MALQLHRVFIHRIEAKGARWKKYSRKSASYWEKHQERAVKISLKRGSNWVLLKSQISQILLSQNVISAIQICESKRFKTPHKHTNSRVGKRSFSCSSNHFMTLWMRHITELCVRFYFLLPLWNDPQVSQSRWIISRINVLYFLYTYSITQMWCNVVKWKFLKYLIPQCNKKKNQ